VVSREERLTRTFVELTDSLVDRFDIVDLLTLLAAWGTCPGQCPPGCAADLDGDCAVGIVDFLILLSNWT